MQIVLIGGGGTVGRLLCPHLLDRHELVVLDPAAPELPQVTHVPAGVTDPGALDALAGADAAVHLAAVVPYPNDDEPSDEADPARVGTVFAVNVGSLYTSLVAAQRHGVAAFVHISSMSVYTDYSLRPVDLTAPADATDPYGLSKRLGEETCRTLAPSQTPGAPQDASQPRTSVCSLRLAFPTPDADWPAWRRPRTGTLEQRRMRDGTPVASLAATDLAAAVEAAMRYRGPYRTFAIVGDPRTIQGDDTGGTLGWAPTRTP